MAAAKATRSMEGLSPEAVAGGLGALPSAESTGAPGWNDLIDHPLRDWLANSSQLDDEETVMPTKETIQLAIQLAGIMSKKGHAIPTRVVPDAHGGIVFERKEGPVFEAIRIAADGRVERSVFRDGRLVSREGLTIPADA
jgi:hypothetical protein